VRTFGATGDGKTIDSSAINKAIETAAAVGGGTVLFPSGVYASYSIRLKSNIAEPYNRMVLAQTPWQKNRTAEAGYKGVSFQRTFSPFTMYQSAPALIPAASTKDYKKLPSDQKSNATFSVLPLIDYYECTQDQTFLRAQLYPALKELDAFWRDFAARDSAGAQWVFEHSSAHEGGRRRQSQP
jgi:hypothetical protein